MRVTMLAAAAALSFSAATVQAGGLLAPEITNVPQAPQMDPQPRGSMGRMGVVAPLAGLLLVCAVACGGGDDTPAVDTQALN